MRIFLSNNPENLKSVNPDATVEAEYGDIVVNGSILTLAHHGNRNNRPCPCSFPNLPDFGIKSIGISHVDLDTIGGIMAIMGVKPDTLMWNKLFWNVISEIDVKGIHKMNKIDIEEAYKEMILSAINAWYAFSESEAGRVFAPRDGNVIDVDLKNHFDVLFTILYFDFDCSKRKNLIEAGEKWVKEKNQLDNESFVYEEKGIILRRSEKFVNHLYRDSKAIVTFNPKTEAIVISLSEPIPGVSCKEVVQSLWGMEAGGHDGIAGSPRGKKMDELDTMAIFNRLKLQL